MCLKTLRHQIEEQSGHVGPTQNNSDETDAPPVIRLHLGTEVSKWFGAEVFGSRGDTSDNKFQRRVKYTYGTHTKFPELFRLQQNLLSYYHYVQLLMVRVCSSRGISSVKLSTHHYLFSRP